MSFTYIPQGCKVDLLHLMRGILTLYQMYELVIWYKNFPFNIYANGRRLESYEPLVDGELYVITETEETRGRGVWSPFKNEQVYKNIL